MRRTRLVGLVAVGVLLFGASAWASAASQIDEATGQGKAVFVVVTQAGAAGTDRALAIARQAQEMAPATALVVLDRGASENQPLVERYRLLGAPVPLILVVASNGVVAGGALLRDASAEALVRTIPTPKKAEMLLHLSQRLPVFVVASRASMADARSAVYEACTQAAQMMERRVATVLVDMDDPAEKAWLEELKIGPREPAPVTVVYNAQAQKTQVFRGPMTAAELVAAARKKAPCCPGGSC